MWSHKPLLKIWHPEHSLGRSNQANTRYNKDDKSVEIQDTQSHHPWNTSQYSRPLDGIRISPPRRRRNESKENNTLTREEIQRLLVQHRRGGEKLSGDIIGSLFRRANQETIDIESILEDISHQEETMRQRIPKVRGKDKGQGREDELSRLLTLDDKLPALDIIPSLHRFGARNVGSNEDATQRQLVLHMLQLGGELSYMNKKKEDHITPTMKSETSSIFTSKPLPGIGEALSTIERKTVSSNSQQQKYTKGLKQRQTQEEGREEEDDILKKRKDDVFTFTRSPQSNNNKNNNKDDEEEQLLFEIYKFMSSAAKTQRAPSPEPPPIRVHTMNGICVDTVDRRGGGGSAMGYEETNLLLEQQEVDRQERMIFDGSSNIRETGNKDVREKDTQGETKEVGNVKTPQNNREGYQRGWNTRGDKDNDKITRLDKDNRMLNPQGYRDNGKGEYVLRRWEMGTQNRSGTFFFVRDEDDDADPINIRERVLSQQQSRMMRNDIIEKRNKSANGETRRDIDSRSRNKYNKNKAKNKRKGGKKIFDDRHSYLEGQDVYDVQDINNSRAPDSGPIVVSRDSAYLSDDTQGEMTEYECSKADLVGIAGISGEKPINGEVIPEIDIEEEEEEEEEEENSSLLIPPPRSSLNHERSKSQSELESRRTLHNLSQRVNESSFGFCKLFSSREKQKRPRSSGILHSYNKSHTSLLYSSPLASLNTIIPAEVTPCITDGDIKKDDKSEKKVAISYESDRVSSSLIPFITHTVKSSNIISLNDEDVQEELMDALEELNSDYKEKNNPIIPQRHMVSRISRTINHKYHQDKRTFFSVVQHPSLEKHEDIKLVSLGFPQLSAALSSDMFIYDHNESIKNIDHCGLISWAVRGIQDDFSSLGLQNNDQNRNLNQSQKYKYTLRGYIELKEQERQELLIDSPHMQTNVHSTERLYQEMLIRFVGGSSIILTNSSLGIDITKLYKVEMSRPPCCHLPFSCSLLPDVSSNDTLTNFNINNNNDLETKYNVFQILRYTHNNEYKDSGFFLHTLPGISIVLQRFGTLTPPNFIDYEAGKSTHSSSHPSQGAQLSPEEEEEYNKNYINSLPSNMGYGSFHLDSDTYDYDDDDDSINDLEHIEEWYGISPECDDGDEEYEYKEGWNTARISSNLNTRRDINYKRRGIDKTDLLALFKCRNRIPGLLFEALLSATHEQLLEYFDEEYSRRRRIRGRATTTTTTGSLDYIQEVKNAANVAAAVVYVSTRLHSSKTLDEFYRHCLYGEACRSSVRLVPLIPLNIHKNNDNNNNKPTILFVDILKAALELWASRLDLQNRDGTVLSALCSRFICIIQQKILNIELRLRYIISVITHEQCSDIHFDRAPLDASIQLENEDRKEEEIVPNSYVFVFHPKTRILCESLANELVYTSFCIGLDPTTLLDSFSGFLTTSAPRLPYTGLRTRNELLYSALHWSEGRNHQIEEGRTRHKLLLSLDGSGAFVTLESSNSTSDIGNELSGDIDNIDNSDGYDDDDIDQNKKKNKKKVRNDILPPNRHKNIVKRLLNKCAMEETSKKNKGTWNNNKPPSSFSSFQSKGKIKR